MRTKCPYCGEYDTADVVFISYTSDPELRACAQKEVEDRVKRKEIVVMDKPFVGVRPYYCNKCKRFFG